MVIFTKHQKITVQDKNVRSVVKEKSPTKIIKKFIFVGKIPFFMLIRVSNSTKYSNQKKTIIAKKRKLCNIEEQQQFSKK